MTAREMESSIVLMADDVLHEAARQLMKSHSIKDDIFFPLLCARFVAESIMMTCKAKGMPMRINCSHYLGSDDIGHDLTDFFIHAVRWNDNNKDDGTYTTRDEPISERWPHSVRLHFDYPHPKLSGVTSSWARVAIELPDGTEERLRKDITAEGSSGFRLDSFLSVLCIMRGHNYVEGAPFTLPPGRQTPAFWLDQSINSAVYYYGNFSACPLERKQWVVDNEDCRLAEGVSGLLNMGLVSVLRVFDGVGGAKGQAKLSQWSKNGCAPDKCFMEGIVTTDAITEIFKNNLFNANDCNILLESFRSVLVDPHFYLNDFARLHLHRYMMGGCFATQLSRFFNYMFHISPELLYDLKHEKRKSKHLNTMQYLINYGFGDMSGILRDNSLSHPVNKKVIENFTSWLRQGVEGEHRGDDDRVNRTVRQIYIMNNDWHTWDEAGKINTHAQQQLKPHIDGWLGLCYAHHHMMIIKAFGTEGLPSDDHWGPGSLEFHQLWVELGHELGPSLPIFRVPRVTAPALPCYTDIAPQTLANYVPCTPISSIASAATTGVVELAADDATPITINHAEGQTGTTKRGGAKSDPGGAKKWKASGPSRPVAGGYPQRPYGYGSSSSTTTWPNAEWNGAVYNPQSPDAWQTIRHITAIMINLSIFTDL